MRRPPEVQRGLISYGDIFLPKQQLLLKTRLKKKCYFTKFLTHEGEIFFIMMMTPML